jgi:hypothetical protein
MGGRQGTGLRLAVGLVGLVATLLVSSPAQAEQILTDGQQSYTFQIRITAMVPQAELQTSLSCDWVPNPQVENGLLARVRLLLPEAARGVPLNTGTTVINGQPLPPVDVRPGNLGGSLYADLLFDAGPFINALAHGPYPAEVDLQVGIGAGHLLHATGSANSPYGK